MNRGLARDDRTWAEYTAKNGPMSLDMVLQVLSNLCWQLRVNERSGKRLTMLSGQSVRVSGRSARAYITQRHSDHSTAPELIKGAEPGSWTVVYQLAALILQGLTGREVPHPLERFEDDEVVPKWLEVLELPPAAAAALLRALELEPAQRYATVNDFLDALGEMPMGMMRDAPRKKPGRPGRKDRRGLWIALAIVLSVLLIGGGALGYYALQRDRYLKSAACLNEYDFQRAGEVIASVPDWMGADVPRIKDLAAAGLLFADGEYEQARAQFERLGSFSVAPVMLVRTDEALAEAAFEKLKSEIAALVQADKLEDAWTKTEQALDSDLTQQRQDILIGHYGELVRSSEEPLVLYKRLDPYKNLEAIKAIRYDLVPSIYEKGEDAFYQGETETAAKYLAAAGSYKKAKDYLKALTSYEPEDLVPYMSSPVIKERLYTTEVLEEYLRGEWSGGGYTLNMDEELSLTTDIPWGKLDAEYYEMEKGMVTQISGEEEEKSFTITVADMDKIKVYSYALDKTVTMNRLDK